jgi:hypothetical protein
MRRKPVSFLLAFCMIPVVLLMLSSCGGGGGSSSGGSVNPGTDAPSVWNLQFSPARAPIDDGSATLYGSYNATNGFVSFSA